MRPARLLVLLGTVVSTTKWGDGLASGTKHSLWITPDDTVAAWGDNTNGQLCDATCTPRLSPMPVPGLADVVAVAAGANHRLAVTHGGTLRTWGYGWYGPPTSPIRITVSFLPSGHA